MRLGYRLSYSALLSRRNSGAKIMFSKDEVETTLLELKLLSTEERYDKLTNILGEECERVNELLEQYRSKRND